MEPAELCLGRLRRGAHTPVVSSTPPGVTATSDNTQPSRTNIPSQSDWFGGDGREVYSEPTGDLDVDPLKPRPEPERSAPRQSGVRRPAYQYDDSFAEGRVATNVDADCILHGRLTERRG